MQTTIQTAGNKRRVHTGLSIFLITLGIALLIYMIIVEDEPGAVPLALIVAGGTWLAISRIRMRPRRQ